MTLLIIAAVVGVIVACVKAGRVGQEPTQTRWWR